MAVGIASGQDAAEAIASSLLEMLGRGKKSEKKLREELDRLNSSIDTQIPSFYGEDWVKRMRRISKLIKNVVDEFSAASLFGNYLTGAGRARREAPKINFIKALLLDVTNFKMFSNSLKELFRRDISPVVGVLIRNYLVGQDPAYRSVAVIRVVSVGETALAGVYKDEAVELHFDFRAWIVEPRSSDVCDAMRSVAGQICATDCGNMDDMSLPEIVGAMRGFLESKRYFLVFEDVRDKRFWDAVEGALPDENNGSRIFITTQSEEVSFDVQRALTSHPRTHELLSERTVLARIQHELESREFRASNSIEFWYIMIKMCEDLPFAIVAVACLLLKNEKFPEKWRKLIKKFCLEVETNENLRFVSSRLALGVRCLPHQLKSCFLYFSLFPKETLIPNDKLFKLWIAEGFVEERFGQSLEEVAQEYLNELISRNLVQAREEFYGIEHFSRVPDLVREILQKEADDHNFGQIWSINKDSRFGENACRLVISNHSVENVLESIAESQLCTAFLSNVGAVNHSFLVGLFTKYELLTLLAIEDSPLELLPNEVGYLSCLKYLSLRNTKLRILPKSVGKLQQLQTLDLTRTLLIELPMEIFLLRNIRHLLVSRCENKISLDPAKGVKIKPGIGYLVNLLTLTVVEAHLSGMDVIQELKKLKKLRSLSVSRLTTELSTALCACIEVTRNLESLRLHSMSNESLDLQNISTPPPHLEHLVLKGLIQKFPNWISRLQNLKVLCLSLSMLTDDPLQRFGLLPFLESLWLYRAYEGQRLHFQEGGFPSLKLLVLRDLQGLESVEIEEGSLPLLEELRIGPSLLLNEVPCGINHLRGLKVISFYNISSEFVMRMKPDEGSKYWKVKHIQSVLIWYRDEGNRYVSYKLHDDDNLWRRLEDMHVDSNDIGQCDSRLSFSYTDDEEDSATSNLQL